MKQLIHIGSRNIVLVSKDLEDEIDMDELTSINPSNLYGELVTCSVLLNKIGTIKSDLEATIAHEKMDYDILEAELKTSIRKEGYATGKIERDGETLKLTEAVISELVSTSPELKKKKRDLIEYSQMLGKIDSLYWAVQSKDKKLNNIVPKVTPEEFYNQLVEGRINSFIIKK